MQYVVICLNSEPIEYIYLFRYFGPFDGKAHAELWLKTVHNNCYDKRTHYVEALEKPHNPAVV